MARFVFNLAVVLKARENAEQAAQRVVAVARQKLVALQDALNDLGTKRRQADDEMRKRLVGPIDVSYVAGHRRFVISMEKQAMDLATQIAQAQAEVDKAQAVLIMAARREKRWKSCGIVNWSVGRKSSRARRRRCWTRPACRSRSRT
ncbi:MAG: hypothetical protein QM754_21010 [Tepidisphaeraceae bacterium]